MSVRRALSIVSAVALLGALAACDSGGSEPGFKTVQIAEGAPIVIGVSTMLEGDLASTGRALADAAELAGQDVSIAGHPIDFVEADDGCTEDGGESAARELVKQDVVAVVGPSCSDAVIGSQPVYEDAGITHISQLSTNVKTTQPDDRGPFRTFLRTCLDQVRYMTSILEPQGLLRRIEAYAEDESRAGRLPRGAYPVLREALLAGELSRGDAGRLTGFQERKGREIVSTLLAKGLLVATSGTHRSAVRLGFPIDVVERWFPRLYPAGLS